MDYTKTLIPSHDVVVQEVNTHYGAPITSIEIASLPLDCARIIGSVPILYRYYHYIVNTRGVSQRGNISDFNVHCFRR